MPLQSLEASPTTAAVTLGSVTYYETDMVRGVNRSVVIRTDWNFPRKHLGICPKMRNFALKIRKCQEVNWTIDYLSETDSTNVWLREHRGVGEVTHITDAAAGGVARAPQDADSRAPQGMDACAPQGGVARAPQGWGRVVWAGYQTAGRGCGTNSWESARGENLLFSVLIRPREVRAADQFILSMANALALRDTMEDYVEDVKIKWPNDIYWRDCKLCGTLIETTLRGQYVGDCIIGTGINVNQRRFLSDAPNPVSLRQILGHDTDCRGVLQKVLGNIAKYMDRVGAGPVPARRANWEAIRAQYRSHLYRLLETHPYRFADGSVKRCRLVNVTDDGHLELRPDSGETLHLAFKEVQFVLSP